jgi:hypothetical protein
MAWTKSPPSLIELFDMSVPSAASITRRKMFGYPAAFANGNLFIGLHQNDFIMRLSEGPRPFQRRIRRAHLRAHEGAADARICAAARGTAGRRAQACILDQAVVTVRRDHHSPAEDPGKKVARVSQ